MKIDRIVVGELEENCYIISMDDKCIVVDPGDEFSKIEKEIGKKKVMACFVTHHHFDHIGALKEVINTYQVPICDFHTLTEGRHEVGPFTFQVIYNPGHTKDSISYYFPNENIMFVGDFIFQNSIGRWDLEGGSFLEMRESIQKIKKYPDDVLLYPGHGVSTTLGYEKKNNSFF